MSLRRKIALWLCPELKELAQLRIDFRSNAAEWARDAQENAEAARKSAEDSSSQADLLCEVIALRGMVEAIRQDMRAQAECISPVMQCVNKTLRRWDEDGMRKPRS